jgi:Fe-S cluster assembly ATP-binding protein
MNELRIEKLHVSVGDKEILRGVDLTVKPGEIHALMGPNGSGKSTLAATLMGHPALAVTEGRIVVDGKNMLGLQPEERAGAGLFLSFQYPVEVPGVRFLNFLHTAVNSQRGKDNVMLFHDFQKLVKEQVGLLDFDGSIMNRSLNEGFSGGEKKRAEILQLAVLQPKYAVLDETDSGLDVDALKIVAKGINALATPERGFLVITHYQRLLDYVKPHFVHVLEKGRITRSGGPELARVIERAGYAKEGVAA